MLYKHLSDEALSALLSDVQRASIQILECNSGDSMTGQEAHFDLAQEEV